MSMYFCTTSLKEVTDCETVRIFAYSRTLEQSNKRSGTRLKTESETGGDAKNTPHTPCGQRKARALRARRTLIPRFSDFKEKRFPDVLQSKY